MKQAKTTKMSSRGQTVIPYDIRKQYGLKEGARMEWIPWDANSIVVKKSSQNKKLTWRKWLQEVDKLDKSVWKDIDPVKYTHDLWDGKTT